MLHHSTLFDDFIMNFKLNIKQAIEKGRNDIESRFDELIYLFEATKLLFFPPINVHVSKRQSY